MADFVKVDDKAYKIGLIFPVRCDDRTTSIFSFCYFSKSCITINRLKEGIGFKGDGNPFHNQDEFNALLSSLASANEVKVDVEEPKFESLEEKSQKSKARVHYKKFTRGKDISKYSTIDLACIVGSGRKETDVEEENDAFEVSKTGDSVHAFGVTTIFGGSIADYFKKKFKSDEKVAEEKENSEKNSDVVTESVHVDEKQKKKKLKIHIEDSAVQDIEELSEPLLKKKRKHSIKSPETDVDYLKAKKSKQDENEFQVETTFEGEDLGQDVSLGKHKHKKCDKVEEANNNFKVSKRTREEKGKLDKNEDEHELNIIISESNDREDLASHKNSVEAQLSKKRKKKSQEIYSTRNHHIRDEVKVADESSIVFSGNDLEGLALHNDNSHEQLRKKNKKKNKEKYPTESSEDVKDKAKETGALVEHSVISYDNDKKRSASHNDRTEDQLNKKKKNKNKEKYLSENPDVNDKAKEIDENNTEMSENSNHEELVSHNDDMKEQYSKKKRKKEKYRSEIFDGVNNEAKEIDESNIIISENNNQEELASPNDNAGGQLSDKKKRKNKEKYHTESSDDVKEINENNAAMSDSNKKKVTSPNDNTGEQFSKKKKKKNKENLLTVSSEDINGETKEADESNLIKTAASQDQCNQEKKKKKAFENKVEKESDCCKITESLEDSMENKIFTESEKKIDKKCYKKKEIDNSIVSDASAQCRNELHTKTKKKKKYKKDSLTPETVSGLILSTNGDDTAPNNENNIIIETANTNNFANSEGARSKVNIKKVAKKFPGASLLNLSGYGVKKKL